MSLPVWMGDNLSQEVIENEQFVDKSKSIAEDIVGGKLDVSLLIERLAGVLTNVDHDIRARGMQLFSNILAALPGDFLSLIQLNFIATFYTDRLKDNHRVVPAALDGILTLIVMKHLPTDASAKLLSSIYHNIPCQQQVRTDRNKIYNIIHTLAINNTEEIKAMGPDFVSGVVSAMDGERDPRNLLLLFSLLPSLLKVIPLGHLCEDMFEVMACYYPIDFNSDPGDPNAITRNELAEKLCLCLCGAPSFAEFCLPLLLEKLDSNLRLAKLDSLKLLKQSCNVFKPSSYDPHVQTLWPLLQKEMSHKTDTELVQCAHDALEAMVGNLCAGASQLDAVSFLKQIQTSMQFLLVDAKTKTALELPLKILHTTAQGSHVSCVFIAENVMPVLANYCLITSDKKLQVVILLYFPKYFQSCRKWNSVESALPHFTPFGDICISAMSSECVDLKVAAFNAVSALPELSEVCDMPALFEIFNHNLQFEKSIPIVKAYKKCLLSLATKNPNNYSYFVTDKLKLDSIVYDSLLLERTLDLLCSLVSIELFTDRIVREVLRFLKDSDVRTAQIIYTALLQNFSDSTLFNYDKIQQIQINYNILHEVFSWADREIQLDTQSMDYLSKLIIIIMKALDANNQLQFLNLYIIKLLNEVNESNTKAVILLEALINSSRLDVYLENYNEVISKSFNVAFNHKDDLAREKACTIIANLLNKHGKGDKLCIVYSDIKQKLGDELDVHLHERSANSIALCSWIAKGLLLSGHSEASHWLTKLINLLCDGKSGQFAAKGFKLIMCESSNTLNSKCYCNTSFLYRQKVFHLLWKTTNSSESNNDASQIREPLMLAWAYILQSISKTVLQMDSSKISPILIESLNFNDVDLLSITLSTLSFLIQLKNPSISDSLQTLLPRCLKLTSYKNMTVRISSLQCLFDIANFYPTVLLLPHKSDVVVHLAKCLDDPKRLVRNVGVKARTRWYLVGSPGEDKAKKL